MVLVSLRWEAVRADRCPLHGNGGPVEAGLFGLALISVLWAYDGFADVSFVSGEVADTAAQPCRERSSRHDRDRRHLSRRERGLSVRQSDRAHGQLAADSRRHDGHDFRPARRRLISVVVTISTFGALMSTMLTAPRIFFAMANDGLFFRQIARVHPRYGTPHVAIAFAAALGVAFVFARTFEQLADTFVLSIWPSMGWRSQGSTGFGARSPSCRVLTACPAIRWSRPCSSRPDLSRRQCARRGSAVDEGHLRHHARGRARVLPCFRNVFPQARPESGPDIRLQLHWMHAVLVRPRQRTVATRGPAVPPKSASCRSAGCCSTPGFDQSHTPPGKIRLSRAISSAVNVTL